jgi:hypothetical protein
MKLHTRIQPLFHEEDPQEIYVNFLNTDGYCSESWYTD